MAPSTYTYQKVHDVDLNEEPPKYEINEPTPNSGKLHGELQGLGWRKRPSVFWLLPSFVLFNLAMGATAMPKMNVLISLICRNLLQGMSTSSHATPTSSLPHGGSSPSLVPRAAHNGYSMSGTSNTAVGNYSNSTIIIGEHNSQCSIKEVESATTMLTLYGNLIAGILGAVFAPIWGKLSDRYGRIKPLAAASTVILASEVVNLLMTVLPDTFSLNWIYVVYLLEGFSGTFILIMAIASSYAADCTLHSERNVALGWFHGAMFFGMAVGPIFGGYLGMMGGQSRPMLIFYTAIVMRLIGIAILFFVPESLAGKGNGIQDTMRVFQTRKLNQSWMDRLNAANPFHTLRTLVPSDSTLGQSFKKNLIALAIINTVMFGSFMGAMNVMMLYSQYIFGWGNKESGIFLSTIGFFRAIATVLILPLAIRLFRRWLSPSASSGFDKIDITLIRLSIISDIIGYAGYAFAPTGFLFTFSGAIASLGAIGITSSEASMTKLVPKSRTGELLGALGFLQAMARIVAPTVANLTYSWTFDTIPQLVFYGLAAAFGVAGLASVWARPDSTSIEMLDGVPGEGEDEGESMLPMGRVGGHCENC